MANIKLTDIDDLIKRVINELSHKQFMRILGEESVKDIRTRTRLGRGVEKSLGNAKSLKKLSTGYKKYRKKIKLSKETRPAKSNLTKTGEMLNEIGTKAKFGEFKIRLKSKRARQKARWNAEMGRVFMNMSKAELKKVVRRLNKRVDKLVNKYFK